MRLLIYIEPTSYLLPLWLEIKARTTVETRVVFLEENFTQPWNLNLRDDPNVEILRGNRFAKLVRLLQLIRQRDVELIDLAGWGHPLLLMALFYAGICRIPVTIESDTKFDPATAIWRRVVKRLILPIIFRIPDLFFPAGTQQAAYFMGYGVPQARIRIAQMSVDVRSIMEKINLYRDKPVSGSNTGKPIVFLYVGRLEPFKGIQDLLEAFDILVQRGENSRLVIAGDGGLRRLVEASVSTYAAVEYLGWISGDALFHAYSRADVFVLPSRIEPWGLVVNEAMAAGLPVIATDRVGCVDDLVHEGRNGYIVPSANPNRLAEVMRTFIQQPEIAASMGLTSRRMISSWTIEDEARILIAAWDELK
jgi:glycosyltransferase involved in cell wall biosynthesis